MRGPCCQRANEAELAFSVLRYDTCVAPASLRQPDECHLAACNADCLAGLQSMAGLVACAHYIEWWSGIKWHAGLISKAVSTSNEAEMLYMVPEVQEIQSLQNNLSLD